MHSNATASNSRDLDIDQSGLKIKWRLVRRWSRFFGRKNLQLTQAAHNAEIMRHRLSRFDSDHSVISDAAHPQERHSDHDAVDRHADGYQNLRRIIYKGPLSPEYGVSDFLEGVTDWIEQRPFIRIEMIWCGHGALKGVLLAQPTPFNLTQTFIDPDDRAGVDCLPASAIVIRPNIRRRTARWTFRVECRKTHPSAANENTLVSHWTAQWIWRVDQRRELFHILEAALHPAPALAAPG